MKKMKKPKQIGADVFFFSKNPFLPLPPSKKKEEG